VEGSLWNREGQSSSSNLRKTNTNIITWIAGMRSNRKSDNYIQRKVILYHNVNPKIIDCHLRKYQVKLTPFFSLNGGSSKVYNSGLTFPIYFFISILCLSIDLFIFLVVWSISIIRLYALESYFPTLALKLPLLVGKSLVLVILYVIVDFLLILCV